MPVTLCETDKIWVDQEADLDEKDNFGKPELLAPKKGRTVMRTANFRYRSGELTNEDVFLFILGVRIARLRVGAPSVEESEASFSGES